MDIVSLGATIVQTYCLGAGALGGGVTRPRLGAIRRAARYREGGSAEERALT